MVWSCWGVFKRKCVPLWGMLQRDYPNGGVSEHGASKARLVCQASHRKPSPARVLTIRTFATDCGSNKMVCPLISLTTSLFNFHVLAHGQPICNPQHGYLSAQSSPPIEGKHRPTQPKLWPLCAAHLEKHNTALSVGVHHSCIRVAASTYPSGC